MVLKKSDWQEFACSAHPSVIRKYMDACEAFLNANNDEQDVQQPYTFSPLPVVKITNTDPARSIGLVHEKLHYIEESVCYFCGLMVPCKEEHVLSANPFTRAQFMIVCKGCRPPTRNM